jgi:hypothetical protein
MTSTTHTRTVRPADRASDPSSGRSRCAPRNRGQAGRRHRAVGPFLYSCPVCELASLPAASRAEVMELARVHDRLHHRGYRTATIAAPSRCESCRREAATTSWTQPRAGAPFLLCQSCATLATGGAR